MHKAVYLVLDPDEPVCRVGVCVLSDVPKDAVFVAECPDAEEMFCRVKNIDTYFEKNETADSIYCETAPDIVAEIFHDFMLVRRNRED